MHDSKDGNATGFLTIDEKERIAVHKNPARLSKVGEPGAWKVQRLYSYKLVEWHFWIATTGILLYIGSQAGRLGIMAASADGHDKGLIVVGNYSQIAWSPKGDRFAAIGRLENLTYQVAIFAPDGRAIARYAFEGSVDRVL